MTRSAAAATTVKLEPQAPPPLTRTRSQQQRWQASKSAEAGSGCGCALSTPEDLSSLPRMSSIDCASLLPAEVDHPPEEVDAAERKVCSLRRQQLPKSAGTSTKDRDAAMKSILKSRQQSKLVAGAYIERTTVEKAVRVVRNREIAQAALASIKQQLVSCSCACIGSPCLRNCVHGASIGTRRGAQSAAQEARGGTEQ
jgi:hypothetical protein